MIWAVGPLEQQITDLLERPARVPDRDWVRSDGRPPDANTRLVLAGLSEEQREEYLFARVQALEDALRQIAHAIDESQPRLDDGS